MTTQRDQAATAQSLFAQYPILTITGPRQSGKTTLSQAAFPQLAYVSLESPDNREFAITDPRGFLEEYSTGAIFDEIQRAPDLVSYIQELVDQDRKNGRFVLTGSQQFRVTHAINQSLAGRTALLKLLPLTIAEAESLDQRRSIEQMIYTGFYPRIHDHKLNPTQALGDYFETYVERDVRQISEIRNLSSFRTFLRLCAGRTGQLFNAHNLSNDVGVSHTTIRQWLSVLEASYIVFLLQPLHANIKKRLVKSPKIYFYDVGLAAYLMGIETARQVATHPLKGALFENLVLMEALKHRFNRGKRSNSSFYRDSAGNEVDLVCSYADRLVGIEMKASATLTSTFFRGLGRLSAALPEPLLDQLLVYGGPNETVRSGVTVTNPYGFAAKLGKIEQRLLD